MFKFVGYADDIVNYAERITDGLYSKNWPIKIEDDDFIENIIIKASNASKAFVIGIIKVYSEKNLNVGLALTLYFKNEEERIKWPISEQVKFYNATVPEFKDHKNNIDKYLMLI
jgi:hypothetical protein